MGCVLHVVREGNDLVVVVVAGSEELRQRGAEQAGSPRTENDERIRGAAVHAIAAQALRTRCVGAIDRNQALLPAARTARSIRLRHVTALAADFNFLAFGALGRRFVFQQGKGVVHIPVTPEKAVVEDPQVAVNMKGAGRLVECPTGGMALAALHQRQV